MQESQSRDLEGKVAIVTGASSGLGRQFCKSLANSGASVVACARRGDRIEELAANIRSAGGNAGAFMLDVTDASNIEAAFDFAEANFGTVDILVNNAGISEAGYATELSLDAVDRLLSTNLRSVFLTSREAARRLKSRSMHGRIINIASVGAYSYTPKSISALYVSTKAAIIRMTEALALEWAADGVNVNAIAPGLFRSEMSEEFISEFGERATARFPRKRFGEPEYLESTLLYLASDNSHFVTGTCIIVDDAQVPR